MDVQVSSPIHMRVGRGYLWLDHVHHHHHPAKKKKCPDIQNKNKGCSVFSAHLETNTWLLCQFCTTELLKLLNNVAHTVILYYL